MKQASTELITLLTSNTTFTTCDFYTITLLDGTYIYLTSSDINIAYNGHTYLNSPLVSRDNISASSGVSVDSLTMTIFPNITDLIGTLTWQKAFRNGTFDGATIQIDKAFFTDWTETPLVLEKLFLGKVDVDNISRSEIKLDIKSVTEILNISVPKILYQANCPWLLYDAATCKVNKSSFTFSGIVQSGSTLTSIKCDLIQSDDYFNQGVILFNSGVNINIKRSVKIYITGEIVLINPLQYIPSSGDTFSIYVGCNHTLEDCTDTFSNEANYGGCPFVPISENIY